jgi:hypothetical protein
VEKIKEDAKRAAMILSKSSEVRKDVSPEPRADTKTERLEQVTKQHSAQRQQQQLAPAQMTKDEQEAVKAIVDKKLTVFSQDV